MIEQMTWNALRPSVTPRFMTNDEIGGDPRHGSHGLTNGGQFGPDHGGDRRIVEPRDGQLVRKIQTEFSRHRYGCSGHIVIARENRRGRFGRPQHSLSAHQPVREIEVAGLDQSGIHRNLLRPHFIDETEVALFRRAMIGTSQHEADASMSELQEV